MSTVSWGAPKLRFVKLEAGQIPDDDDFNGISAIVIDGDVLLENSSTLSASAGDKRELRNERGETVDSKQMPASYTFTTSLIRKKADGGNPFADDLLNGVVKGDWAMRLEPEDNTTVGFQMRKGSITIDKGWDSQQGALDVITFNGVVPNLPSSGVTDADKEICQDWSYIPPTPGPDEG